MEAEAAASTIGAAGSVSAFGAVCAHPAMPVHRRGGSERMALGPEEGQDCGVAATGPSTLAVGDAVGGQRRLDRTFPLATSTLSNGLKFRFHLSLPVSAIFGWPVPKPLVIEPAWAGGASVGPHARQGAVRP